MIEQTVNLDQLQEDIVLLHSFVHGHESDSVMLGQVNTPSLRNLVATIRLNVERLIAALNGYEERILRLETALEQFGVTVADGDETYNVQTLHSLVRDEAGQSD